MSYINFVELKKALAIQEVTVDFDIQLKGSGSQLRGQCPKCQGSERGLAVNTNDQSFYCHSEKLGGDVIALIAHTEGVRMREAAEAIAERCGYNGSETPKTEPKREEQPTNELQPLSYLVYDHESVPMDAETAEALGIGYAPRGIMRGHLAIPVRLADGTLAGYVGVAKGTELKLPKKFIIS